MCTYFYNANAVISSKKRRKTKKIKFSKCWDSLFVQSSVMHLTSLRVIFPDWFCCRWSWEAEVYDWYGKLYFSLSSSMCVCNAHMIEKDIFFFNNINAIWFGTSLQTNMKRSIFTADFYIWRGWSITVGCHCSWCGQGFWCPHGISCPLARFLNSCNFNIWWSKILVLPKNINLLNMHLTYWSYLNL